jgi:hypothetical protein
VLSCQYEVSVNKRMGNDTFVRLTRQMLRTAVFLYIIVASVRYDLFDL